MQVFSAPDFADHEQVVFCADLAAGLKLIIAIHDTRLGPAVGGCRMWPYADEDGALADALRLSKAMTYKAAVAGLAFGGGKAVILGDPARDKTPRLLEALGVAVERLNGRYLMAEDVGMTLADLELARRSTRFVAGIADAAGNPSPATAYGVFLGIRSAVAHRLARSSLKGLRVAVQGAGSVGARLCRYLADDGAEVFVSDLDRAAVDRLRRVVPVHPVPPGALLEMAVDLLAPCALGGILNDTTIPRLRCAIIAGAANNQLARPGHAFDLMARGILYVPDYVINAGGLIDIACEGPDYSVDKVLAQVETIGARLTRILDQADAEGLPPAVIADRLAEQRLRAALTPPE